MGLVIPQSLDRIDWREAKEVFDELETTPPHSQPPSKEVNRFIKESAHKFAGEIASLLARMQTVFHTHLPQRHGLAARIKDFKYRLRLKLIRPTDLPNVQERVSTELPEEQNPVEDPDIGINLREAPEKLSFVRRLIRRLPQSFFHRRNRDLARTVEELSSQCKELVTFRTYVGEVREVQACIAGFRELDARRLALVEEMAPLQGVREEREQILAIQDRYSRLFTDLEQLQREVERIHREYPGLFAHDLEQLMETMRHDRQHLFFPLLAGSAPSPFASIAKYIREILNKVSFKDLLTPRNIDYMFLRSRALDYKSKKKVKYPKEYKDAHTLTETVHAYKSVRRALREGTLHISQDSVAYLVTLDDTTIAPLRELVETHAPPHIKGRTPQMQRRLIDHMKGIFSICPSLCSDASKAQLEKIEKRLAPPAPKEYHSAHERELRENMSLDIKIEYLRSLARMIQTNNFEGLTQNTLRLIRDVCAPNYPSFHNFILKTLRSNELSMSTNHLASFIGYIQQLIKHIPALDATGDIRAEIRRILRADRIVAGHIASNPVFIPWVFEPCCKCIKHKIKADEWEDLTYSEVQRFRSIYSNEHKAFAARLQHVLDTSTRSEILKWKEDHFDPFIEFHNEPMRSTGGRDLLDLECVQVFVVEATFRITPPTFWAWIIVLFGDLLRLFRH